VASQDGDQAFEHPAYRSLLELPRNRPPRHALSSQSAALTARRSQT
jgi:hypothetical protein